VHPRVNAHARERNSIREPSATLEVAMRTELRRTPALIRALMGTAALAVTLSIGLALEATASRTYHQELAAASPAASSVMVAQARDAH
jgi:hypothetical protein